jgi:hypothetical protein
MRIALWTGICLQNLQFLTHLSSSFLGFLSVPALPCHLDHIQCLQVRYGRRLIDRERHGTPWLESSSYLVLDDLAQLSESLSCTFRVTRVEPPLGMALSVPPSSTKIHRRQRQIFPAKKTCLLTAPKVWQRRRQRWLALVAC